MSQMGMVRRAWHSGLPLPSQGKPLIRGLHRAGIGAAELFRWLYAWGIVNPVVRSLVEGGERLRVERMPYIRGPGRIVMGADVYISGEIGIGFSRHARRRPEFHIGSRTFIGHDCAFSILESITIGNDCLIAGGVRISDNDGHPVDPAQRRARQPVPGADAQPVVLEDNVWIGARAIILKGLRIGCNSVVGAGAVVTADVPRNCIVAGNPARTIRHIA